MQFVVGLCALCGIGLTNYEETLRYLLVHILCDILFTLLSILDKFRA